MALRVYVDFNTMGMDQEERVLINTAVQNGLIDHLRPGLPVMLYDETLEVKAVVEFDETDQRWWGRPDWSTSRDLPHAGSTGKADDGMPVREAPLEEV